MRKFRTPEFIKSEIDSCTTRKEFHAKHYGSYIKLVINQESEGYGEVWKYLNDRLPSMHKKGCPYKHTRDKIEELASQCSTSREFFLKHPNETNAVKIHGYWKELCEKMHWNESVRDDPKHTFEKDLTAARQFSSLADFTNNANTSYCSAARNGYLADICKAMGWVRRDTSRTYTYDELLDEIRKCRTLEDFRRDHHKMYAAAYRYGEIAKLAEAVGFKYEKRKHSKNIITTYDKILKVAKRCETRGKFISKHRDLYQYILRKTGMKSRIYAEMGWRENQHH